MPIKVLIVDDSSFFRNRLTDVLGKDPQLTVVGTACNGQEAISQALRLNPDVITMDVEMPVMDGITAVRRIMSVRPIPILMFSSLTKDGAKATLDALDAGAVDFLPKQFEDIALRSDQVASIVQQRVRAIARRSKLRSPSLMQRQAVARMRSRTDIEQPVQVAPTRQRSALMNNELKNETPLASAQTHATMPAHTTVSHPHVAASGRKIGSGKKYRLLAIGTSTGGPVALQKILTNFPTDYPLPIVITQHMPAAFTAPFASRLDSLCQIQVKEAEDGEILKPGVAYLAPGGLQMLVEKGGIYGRLKVTAGDEKLNYKPSVDVTFTSAAQVFAGDVLGVILTGMGADGREGCRILQSAGATIWAQDEASSVVYGMPQAVAVAGISSLSIALELIADAILKETMSR